MTYDLLGRMLTRSEGAAMSSVWIYGNASNQSTYPNSIDKLVSESCTGTACGTGGSGGSYGRVYTYDTYGRPSGTTVNLPSASYYTTASYDTVSGKMTDARAFSGFLTHYAFNSWGYESEIDDGTNHAIVYWKPVTRDAEMHLTQEAMGLVPGVSTGPVVNRSFDPNSGRVLTTTSGASNAVAALNTDWDTAGNLADRGDTHAVGWQNENFCYDAMNRVTDASFDGTGASATRCSNGSRHLHMTYDAVGNILSKSDTGTYSYGTTITSGAGPHALTSIATSLGCTQSGGCTVDGLTNPTYAYDANGNMTSGAGRTVSYTSFNMTKTVTVGATSNSITLAYDPDHARSRQTSTVGGVSTVTTYLNDAATNVMSENVKVGTAASQWKNYIVVDGHAVAQRLGSGSTAVMTYFVLDHLGSVAVITDANGQTLKDSNNVETGRQFFDVWGRMRNADGSPDTSCALPANSAATRGYTNQEQIAAVCLDNYNARLYDPQVGRFLTADPSDGSGLNRYWYVGDNPLSLTDPTGLCFLGCFWKSPLGKAAIEIVIYIVLQQDWALPAAFTDMGLTAAQAATASTLLAGGISGYVATGSIQGAVLASAEALTMQTLGVSMSKGLGSAMGDLRIGAFVARGFIGGIFSAAGHGGFVAGFMAAGFSSLADSFDVGNFEGNVLIHALAGGVGSVLGGGKFANGAVTGAFGYAAWSAVEDVEATSTFIGSGQITEALERDGVQDQKNVDIAAATVKQFFADNPELAKQTPDVDIKDLLVIYKHVPGVDPDGRPIGSSQMERVFRSLSSGKVDEVQGIVDNTIVLYAGAGESVNTAIKLILHEIGHHALSVLPTEFGEMNRGSGANSDPTERAADRYAQNIFNQMDR